MMDSDDDDIYPEHHGSNGYTGQDEVKMEDVDEEEEEGEEVEDDSDDEVNFITDAKEEPKQEPGSQPKKQPAILQAPSETRKTSSSTPQPIVRGGSTQDIKAESQPPDDRPGTDYPARHTSKLNPNGNPVHPGTGKPILSTDFDTDFPTDSTKPWRKPGADVTDYFNYGFDEFTWASYCLKQQQMPKEVKEINQQAEQMKAFVEGIPGGGMPGMPGFPTGPAAGTSNSGGGMPSMPGMPSEAEMQQMFQTMMAQGMDPTSMDSNQFMQMMMGGGPGGMMGGNQPPTGPQASFGGGGGGGGFDQGGGGGGFGGRGGRGRGRRNW